jgi:Holliday junction resolvase
MAAESKIQKKITNWLEAEGYYVVKIVSATKAGVPDVLACVNGKFLAIEVKTSETRDNVSPLQVYNLQKVIKSGGDAIVAWELEQVKKFVKSML